MKPYLPTEQPTYNVLTLRGRDPTKIWELPFSAVIGGQLLIGLNENLSPYATAATPLQDALTIEVTIVGKIGHARDVLRTQYVRACSGPLLHSFDLWEAYSVIEVEARNMSGGMIPPAAYYGGSNPGNVGEGATLHYADLTCSIQGRCVSPSTGDKV